MKLIYIIIAILASACYGMAFALFTTIPFLFVAMLICLYSYFELLKLKLLSEQVKELQYIKIATTINSLDPDIVAKLADQVIKERKEKK